MRFTVRFASDYLLQKPRPSQRNSMQILNRFRALLKLARVCSASCDGVKDDYDCAAQPPGLPLVFYAPWNCATPDYESSEIPVRFAFAGSLYSKE